MNNYLERILGEVDVDQDGLSHVLGVPAKWIRDWCAGRKEAPKWFVAYLDMVLALQEIGRITYGKIGDPCE